MKCRESRRLFNRHLDGRLTEEERRSLDAHLAACDRCRAELAAWEVPARALRAMGAIAAPVGLAERSWRAALTAGDGRPPSFEERFVWAARRAAAAGAMAAALVWGGFLWQDSPAGDADLASPPDAAEVAMSLWAADPGVELVGEGAADGE